MATIFVDSRNGNDSNNGSSWALAKKTLGAAIPAAGSSGIVNATGVFTEVVTVNQPSIVINAVGFAVIDGQGVSSYLLGVDNIGISTATINGFIFKNAVNYAIYHYNDANRRLALNNCTISDSPYGIYVSVAGSLTLRDCTFTDCSSFGVYQTGNNLYTEDYRRNTFVRCSTAIYAADANVRMFAGNNVFRSNSVRHIKLTSAVNLLAGSDYNNIDFGSGSCEVASVAKTTLVDWQTATSRDTNSISADPQFVDEAKRLYMLRPSSPSLVNGSLINGSIIQGAWNIVRGTGASSNYDPYGAWANKVLVNTEVDGAGNIVLSTGQTVGTATFLFDFGSQIDIKKLDFSHVYGWPTSIVDYNKTDSLPETWQYRYRTSTSATPPSGAFTTASWLVNLNLTGIRQLEIEFTLRKDA